MRIKTPTKHIVAWKKRRLMGGSASKTTPMAGQLRGFVVGGSIEDRP
ncbi:hypothetical protein [Desulfohalobium retbaense]|uniref:Uncharacterized protein n=1 Tax=Desulfohalobium retbaense (strain ATCC 49708 / DSM 5692 / JCM 16813 / HR100) TaxID=485915 RepID=C8X1U8_DESRD|nr:hypothetical protein [Desulfohalobium retbaense]ACV68520.1 hypothetical protein Dret_1232 [Desulfohalobium retbaense DSM 5692]